MANILIIDDSEMLRDMFSRVLKSAKHTVVTAIDGAAGAELFGTQKFDIVISDIFMPNGDGIQAVRAIRARDPKVAIIVVSGYEVMKMATDLGADFNLQKPVSKKKLLATVEEALAKLGTAPG